MNDIKQRDLYIRKTVLRNSKKLPADSAAQKLAYPAKIIALSTAIGSYCHQCEETVNYQTMLKELADDLPELLNPSAPVKRSIEKRFKVMIKHLQEAHGLSTPQQFTEGGITLAASVLGMAGFVMMAFNMNVIYPLAGLLIGGISGYYWGKKRDQRAENEKTVLHFKKTT